MKDWVKITLMVVGIAWGLGDCVNKYKMKDWSSQNKPETFSETHSPMEEMQEPITTIRVYGRVTRALNWFFRTCECCDSVLRRKLCEEKRNKLREEIIGKLLIDWIEISDLERGEKGEGWVEVELEREVQDVYCEKCLGGSMENSGLKITGYDSDKHIIEFTLYHLMVKREGLGDRMAPLEGMCPRPPRVSEEEYRNMCWGPYLITFDPSVILKTQFNPEFDILETIGDQQPFKKITKEFSSNEEAMEWLKGRKGTIKYLIRVEKPFSIYHPDFNICFYGLIGDIVGYRVETWGEEEWGVKLRKEILVSYPAGEWEIILEQEEKK
jgi:hypothetical protein